MTFLTFCILNSRRIDFFGPKYGLPAKTRKKIHNVLFYNRMTENSLSK